MMSDWFYIIVLLPGLVAVACIVVVKLCDLIMDVAYRDGGHTRRHARYMEEARRAGLTYHQAVGELAVRTEIARIRREASDAVRRNPNEWVDLIDNAKKEAFERMAMTNPDLIPALSGALAGLSYGHILYPAEAQMVDRAIYSDRASKPTQDEIAALRIVKPG